MRRWPTTELTVTETVTKMWEKKSLTITKIVLVTKTKLPTKTIIELIHNKHNQMI